MFKKALSVTTVLSFLCVLLFPFISSAKDFDWQGTEIQTTVGGTKNLQEDDNPLFWQASVNSVTNLGKDSTCTKFYSGPIVKKLSFWISPQVGLITNWKGHDALLFSVWSGYSFLNNNLSSVIKADIYVNGDLTQNVDYAGYYAFTYKFLKVFDIGGNAKQADTLVAFGPHLGFTSGVYHTEVQYYAGVQDENYGHTVRIVTALNFK